MNEYLKSISKVSLMYRQTSAMIFIVISTAKDIYMKYLYCKGRAIAAGVVEGSNETYMTSSTGKKWNTHLTMNNAQLDRNTVQDVDVHRTIEYG